MGIIVMNQMFLFWIIHVHTEQGITNNYYIPHDPASAAMILDH